MKIIVETEETKVVKIAENLYDVYSKGVKTHPNCSSEAAMRALGIYLGALEYRLTKEKN